MTTPTECSAGCGVPLDPLLVQLGMTQHPGCEHDVALSFTEYIKIMHGVTRERHRREYVKRPQNRKIRTPDGGDEWIPVPYYEPPRPEDRPVGWRPPPPRPAAWPAPIERPQGRPQVLTSPRDSDVQRAGAEFALPKAGSRRRQVYDAIAAAGRRGLAHFEIEATTGRSYSQNGPRVRELVADGHVVEAPRKRPAPSGAAQAIWVASIHVPPGTDPYDR